MVRNDLREVEVQNPWQWAKKHEKIEEVVRENAGWLRSDFNKKIDRGKKT